MRGMRRILAASDFSERSARAETRAAMLCEGLNCWALELLTVKDPALRETMAHALNSMPTVAEDVLMDRALQGLGRISARLQDDYRVHCMPAVRFGRPAAEIIARADEIKADLVVIGAHGSDYSGDLYLGNNADKLARMTTRPLLIVKNQPDAPYREVLVPVDFSEDSMRAAEMALQIAPEAHVSFLHSCDMRFEDQLLEAGVSREAVLKYRADAYGSAQRELDRFIAELGPIPQPVSRIVKPGLPAEIISRYAETIKPDLVAMGKHGGSRVQELLLGSVMRRAVNKAVCDVLVATVTPSAKEWREPDAA
jgi:nucleotide-binding universal stress UspA family protein